MAEAGRVQDLVAKAIKAADNSFFNENYAKQADAVLRALKQAGYEVVPVKPSPELAEYINQNLPVGRHRPGELVAALYTLIVENARRFEK